MQNGEYKLCQLDAHRDRDFSWQSLVLFNTIFCKTFKLKAQEAEPLKFSENLLAFKRRVWCIGSP